MIWSVIALCTVGVVGLVVYDINSGAPPPTALGNSAINGKSETTSATSESLRLVFTKLDEQFREQIFILPFDPELLKDGHDPDAASAEAIQISDAEISIWDFTASHNRAQVVYAAMNQDSTSDLWLLSNDSKQSQQLLRCEESSCNSPALSPDGRFLAFTKRGTATVTTSGGLSPPRLWLMNLESNETAQIFSDNQTLGYSTSWSASSQWISYLSPESNGISLYNLEDAQSQFFETQSGELGAWHPRRDELLITKLLQMDSQFLIHIYLVEPTTGTLVDLSSESAEVDDSSPAWSPDGEWIVFRRRVLGADAVPGKQLWIMRGDGTEARALTDAPGFDHGQPAWSPDGRYLLYHRFPLQGPDITLSIWLTDMDTGQHFEIIRPGQRPQWG